MRVGHHLALAALLQVFAWTNGEKVAVLPVSATSLGGDNKLVTRWEAALEVSGKHVVSTERLRATLAAAHPFPPPQSPPFAEHLATAKNAYYRLQEYNRARELLQRIRAETTRCAELRETLLLLALVELTEQRIEPAKAALAELFRRAGLDVHIAPAQYPPPLRVLATEVRNTLLSAGLSTVEVHTQPLGAAVHLGICRSGQGPTRFERLIRGRYRVWSDGGRVHTVALKTGEARVELDRDFDGALRTAPLGFVGLREKWLPKLGARIGVPLGVDTLILVEPIGHGARVLRIDVRQGVLFAEVTVAVSAEATAIAALYAPRTPARRLFDTPAAATSASVWTRARTWAYATLGLGAGLALAGGLTGLSAQRSGDAITRQQSERSLTLTRWQALRTGMERSALAADVLYGLAGAAAVTSVVLFVTGRRAETTQGASLSVGLTGAMLSWRCPGRLLAIGDGRAWVPPWGGVLVSSSTGLWVLVRQDDSWRWARPSLPGSRGCPRPRSPRHGHHHRGRGLHRRPEARRLAAPAHRSSRSCRRFGLPGMARSRSTEEAPPDRNRPQANGHRAPGRSKRTLSVEGACITHARGSS